MRSGIEDGSAIVGPTQGEHRIEIDGKRQPPVLDGQREQIASPVDVGIVAKHLDAAFLRHHAGDDGPAALGSRDVAGESSRLAIASADRDPVLEAHDLPQIAAAADAPGARYSRFP